MCIYNVKLCNKFLLASPSQDYSLWSAAYDGKLNDIKKGIQGGTDVNARYKVSQYNYSNISVVYK